MVSELVAQLREYADIDAAEGGNPAVIKATYDAADRIEALEADNRMKDELLTAAVGDYNRALEAIRTEEERAAADGHGAEYVARNILFAIRSRTTEGENG